MNIVTADITKNEIFVYGANEKGIHGAGAALVAARKYGAQIGKFGFCAYSYGIPTKYDPYHSLPLDMVKQHVEVFLEFADRANWMTFKVTPIGCGLAGFKIKDIAPLFDVITPNIVLPDEFLDFFKEEENEAHRLLK